MSKIIQLFSFELFNFDLQVQASMLNCKSKYSKYQTLFYFLHINIQDTSICFHQNKIYYKGQHPELNK